MIRFIEASANWHVFSTSPIMSNKQLHIYITSVTQQHPYTKYVAF